MLVLFFFPIPFLFQTLLNFTWPHPSCDFVACELIKYNGFPMSRKKADEIPYLILYTIIKQPGSILALWDFKFVKAVNMENIRHFQL